jgi:hypothetical protein
MYPGQIYHFSISKVLFRAWVVLSAILTTFGNIFRRQMAENAMQYPTLKRQTPSHLGRLKGLRRPCSAATVFYENSKNGALYSSLELITTTLFHRNHHA